MPLDKQGHSEAGVNIQQKDETYAQALKTKRGNQDPSNYGKVASAADAASLGYDAAVHNTIADAISSRQTKTAKKYKGAS